MGGCFYLMSAVLLLYLRWFNAVHGPWGTPGGYIRGSTADSRAAGAFEAVGSTATRAPPLCLSGARKRALSAQGHFGSCVPPQLPAELPFLQ
jgi:hypothetical protein